MRVLISTAICIVMIVRIGVLANFEIKRFSIWTGGNRVFDDREEAISDQKQKF